MIARPSRVALLALPVALCLPAPAAGEPTLELRLRGPAEIFAGDPVSTSVDARGRIGMGPQQRALGAARDFPSATLRAVDGRVLLGTAQGGLLELKGDALQPLVPPEEGQVITAVAAAAGATYYATAPEAGVYRLEGGELKPYMSPEAQYVWALEPDRGDLLVATGDPAKLLRMKPSGAIETVLETEETHVRAVLRHPKRGLIAGGGGKGIVYQIDDAGAVFALYDSELEEVSSLAVDEGTGDLFAAFVSETSVGKSAFGKTIGKVGDDVDADAAVVKGSEVVRIAPDGRVDLLWSSRREGALALVFEPKSRRLFIATGGPGSSKGRIYAVETGARDRVLLHTRTEAPVIAGLAASGGGLLAATGPKAQLIRIEDRPRPRAVYLSEAQDLSRSARIGRLWYDARRPGGSRVRLAMRAGNTAEPDATWSPWSADVSEPSGGPVKVPKARYVQFRATLEAGPKGAEPRVRSLHASVVRMNVAPRVREVFALAPGVYMKAIPAESEKEKTTTLSESALERLKPGGPPKDKDVRVRQGKRPGMMSVGWTASDDNGDGLIFDVELRALPDGPWLRVQRRTELPFYTFDSRAYADGEYQVRVTASDRPDNPPDRALSDAGLSEPFVVDNSPPALSGLTARLLSGGRVQVRVSARDAMTPLASAEISVDGGPWLMLPAKDGLLDARQEQLSVVASVDPHRDAHFVGVRVRDEAGNVTAAQAAATKVK